MDAYQSFLDARANRGADEGFEPSDLAPSLFPFQRALVEWAVRKGRGAVFADTGLGKTLIELSVADNVVRKTNKPVLLLTPLAVGHQTVSEAGKFGFLATRSRDGSVPSTSIIVANYERIHMFNPSEFGGVVCDESSILKNADGTTRAQVTAWMRKVPYRMLCTATAAPNDYTELGTSSEALGYLGYTDMLTRFFKNENGSVRPFVFGLRKEYDGGDKWRFKGHAERPFWRWVCSWARAVRKPSDLGYSDDGYVLPGLEQEEHVVTTGGPRDGMLFDLPAEGLAEQREERRRTIDERCRTVADLVNHTGEPALVWCHLNPEGDKLAKLIPDAVQVSGANTDDEKEEAFLAFIRGDKRVLITKPSIGAWGLNFQHCAHITMFPSHSYEQTYQGIRRCYRFGQTRRVKVDMVTTPGERGVLANLQKKQAKADTMFANLVAEMNQAIAVDRVNDHTKDMRRPTWLSETK